MKIFFIFLILLLWLGCINFSIMLLNTSDSLYNVAGLAVLVVSSIGTINLINSLRNF